MTKQARKELYLFFVKINNKKQHADLDFPQ